MENYDIEGNFSPDSWSTCDIASLHDGPGSTQKESSGPKVKSYVKKIFFAIKLQTNALKSNFSDLNNYINSIFLEEIPESLCQKLDYYCCNKKKHGNHCIKKWKNIHEQLLALASEANEPKMVFSIRKRQNQTSRVLLNESQPHWIHRLFLQTFLVMSNN
jgi:hypothetical protein